MDKNYHYFLEADTSNYLGEWIAIIDERVVAHGKKIEDVYAKAKHEYPTKRPLITKVPTKKIMIL